MPPAWDGDKGAVTALGLCLGEAILMKPTNSMQSPAQPRCVTLTLNRCVCPSPLNSKIDFFFFLEDETLCLLFPLHALMVPRW